MNILETQIENLKHIRGFTQEEADIFYSHTPGTYVDYGDKLRKSGQEPEEYIMSRVEAKPEIADYEGIPEEIRYKIKLKLNEKVNKPMQTELAVIRNRDMKFIVLERFSGERYECHSINEAKQHVQRSIGENTEFIILEVKAIAGPKKPEVHWDSLEEQFEPVED